MSAPVRSVPGRLPKGATHRFHIGELVTMKRLYGIAINPADIYRVTATLPVRDNSPQYRIRNDDERHERVATEESLEPVSGSTAGEHTALVDRTFEP